MVNSVDVKSAKAQLDKVLHKQRVSFYKPIQIAEILYHVRRGDLTLEALHNIEAYRNPSKKWRDIVCKELIDQLCTSSQRFQDNLFDNNAIPPDILYALGIENNKYPGVVERYIYLHFWDRQKHILTLSNILKDAKPANFNLESFLNYFIHEPYMKRSIDKAYEIVIFALFNTLVKHLKVQVTLSTDPKKSALLKKFDDFARLVLGIDSQHPSITIDAKLYRAGATNAADRGLDMWANFGPVIQVKHLTLTLDEAEEISEKIDSDRIIIVCKDTDKATIESILAQLGQKVKSVITQSQLVKWYNEALHGEFAGSLGEDLIANLRLEFRNEFPYSQTFNQFYEERKYNQMSKNSSIFWMEQNAQQTLH